MGFFLCQKIYPPCQSSELSFTYHTHVHNFAVFEILSFIAIKKQKFDKKSVLCRTTTVITYNHFDNPLYNFVSVIVTVFQIFSKRIREILPVVTFKLLKSIRKRNFSNR